MASLRYLPSPTLTPVSMSEVEARLPGVLAGLLFGLHEIGQGLILTRMQDFPRRLVHRFLPGWQAIGGGVTAFPEQVDDMLLRAGRRNILTLPFGIVGKETVEIRRQLDVFLDALDTALAFHHHRIGDPGSTVMGRRPLPDGVEILQLEDFKSAGTIFEHDGAIVKQLF